MCNRKGENLTLDCESNQESRHFLSGALRLIIELPRFDSQSSPRFSHFKYVYTFIYIALAKIICLEDNLRREEDCGLDHMNCGYWPG